MIHHSPFTPLFGEECIDNHLLVDWCWWCYLHWERVVETTKVCEIYPQTIWLKVETYLLFETTLCWVCFFQSLQPLDKGGTLRPWNDEVSCLGWLSDLTWVGNDLRIWNGWINMLDMELTLFQEWLLFGKQNIFACTMLPQPETASFSHFKACWPSSKEVCLD